MRRFLCFAAVVLSLLSFALAAESDVYERQYDALGLEDLEKSKPEEAEDIELSPDISLERELGGLWNKLRYGIGDIFKSGLRCVAMIIAVSFLCSAVSAMGGAADTVQVKNCVSLVGALAVTGAAAGSINSVIGMGSSAIDSINTFSKSLLPTLAAAGAASGSPTAALVRSTATVLFSDVLITIINYVLLPLVYVLIFASTADAAAPNDSLKRIATIAGKVISGALKLILGVFVSYITVAGIISGGVDKAGLKTAQFAISGAVPVVGGIISEAAETVIAGAALMKNIVGVFGMLTILSVCATPFAALAINYFLFKLAAAVASPVIDSRISTLTDNIGTSFGLVFAMVAASATVMFISIVISMYAVGAA